MSSRKRFKARSRIQKLIKIKNKTSITKIKKIITIKSNKNKEPASKVRRICLENCYIFQFIDSNFLIFLFSKFIKFYLYFLIVLNHFISVLKVNN